jgi:hypothetical protein
MRLRIAKLISALALSSIVAYVKNYDHTGVPEAAITPTRNDTEEEEQES